MNTTPETTVVTEGRAHKVIDIIVQAICNLGKNLLAFALVFIMTLVASAYGCWTALATTYGENLKYRSGSIEEVAVTAVTGALTVLITCWGFFFLARFVIQTLRPSK